MPSGIGAIGVNFDSGAYLNRIKNIQTTVPVNSVPPVTAPSTAQPSTPATNNNQSNAGTGQIELSSAVLSALQSANTNSTGGRVIGSLLDSTGTATSDFLSGIYGTALFRYSSTNALTQAVQATRAQALNDRAANNTPVQNLISAYNNAQNAQNSILQQNVRTEVNRILGSQPSIIA